MFPEKKIKPNGLPLPDSTHQETVILAAKNETTIPQYESVNTQCVINHDWRNIKFYVVISEGPAELGLAFF